MRFALVCHVIYLFARCLATEVVDPSELIVHARDIGDENCNTFLHVPNSMTLQGEVYRKVGEGYTATECRHSCSSTSDFYCVAAQLQLPSTCFVTGYRLRNDHFSAHYSRTCDHGPSCFQRSDGLSTGIKASVRVPSQFVGTQVQALYCMASCELIGAGCVGFDFRTDGNKPRCVLANVGVYASSAFDLYVRRC